MNPIKNRFCYDLDQCNRNPGSVVHAFLANTRSGPSVGDGVSRRQLDEGSAALRNPRHHQDAREMGSCGEASRDSRRPPGGETCDALVSSQLPLAQRRREEQGRGRSAMVDPRGLESGETSASSPWPVGRWVRGPRCLFTNGSGLHEVDGLTKTATW